MDSAGIGTTWLGSLAPAAQAGDAEVGAKANAQASLGEIPHSAEKSSVLRAPTISLRVNTGKGLHVAGTSLACAT